MMQNEIVEQLTKDKTKKIKLTNDWVFKKIFSKPENNQALKELLEAILNIKIDKVEVKNPEMSKNYMDEKLGILDIKAYINENIVTDIEMQVSNVSNMVDRDISYMAKLQTELVHIKEDYTVIKKVISINILGENLIKRNEYHSVAHMKFEKTKEHESHCPGKGDLKPPALLVLISAHSGKNRGNGRRNSSQSASGKDGSAPFGKIPFAAGTAPFSALLSEGTALSVPFRRKDAESRWGRKGKIVSLPKRPAPQAAFP